MKKLISKIVSLIIIAALLTVLAVTPFNAAGTLFTYGHFSYWDVDDYYVALHGFDNSSEQMVIPDMCSSKYVQSIDDYAFEKNTVITSVDFSECTRLDTIGVSAFANCTNLSGDLVLPECVNTLGRLAFQGCSSLSSVEINCNVDEIPEQCFNRCTNLKTVYLPISAKTIGNLAFANCPILRDVYIPESVKSISNTAFLNSGDIVIHCFYDSYAYNFAKNNNIPYVLLDDPARGDVNGDGEINILDVTRIQKYRAGIVDLNEMELLRADVNRDGDVTIRDATLIQMYIADKITEF